MSNWFYYNEQGEKIAVTGGQLKWLAKNGKITPGTLVETENGVKAPAKKVKGLTFITSGATLPETASPTPAQSVESEIYGLAAPPPKPSPFTAAIPTAEDMSVTDPSVVANPFTASMSTTAKSAESPFTVAVPPTAPIANPEWVTAIENSPIVKISKVAHGVGESDDESENVSNPVPIFIGLGVGLFVLVLIVIGISNSGGGSLGSKKTVSVAQAYVEAVIRNEAGILDLDSGWSRKDVTGFKHSGDGFPALYDTKRGKYGEELEPKPGFENTCKLVKGVYDRALTIPGIYARLANTPLDRSLFKNTYSKNFRELIRLAIEEVEGLGGQSSVFDDWKRSQGGVSGGSRVNSNAVALAQLKQAAETVKDFNEAIRGNERDMEAAYRKFGNQVSGCSPAYQSAHAELWTAMTYVNEARTARSGSRDVDGRIFEQYVREYINAAYRYKDALDKEIARLESGGR